MEQQELETIINRGIKEAHADGIQSGKKENSDLVSEMKDTHRGIIDGITGIIKRLDTLNGSVAKQQDKLAQHDVINAQMTITQQQIIESLKELKVTDLATLKKSDEENTTFRNKADGSLSTFKWLFGFLGFGNIVMIIKLFFN